MPRKKTNKEFKQEVYNLVGNEYTVIGTYSGSHNKVRIKHNKCGEIFNMAAGNFLNGQRCPKERNSRIAKSKLISPELFEKRVKEKFGETLYIINTKYTSSSETINVTHSVCGKSFNIHPNDLLRRGCPLCSRLNAFKKETKSQSEFEAEVYDATDGAYKVLGKYIRWDCPILMRHEVCGYEYKVQPNSFKQGRRCPNCGKSNGERIIEDYLLCNNIEFESPKTFSDLKDKRKLHYDFWVPKYNLLIEYQGRQHYQARKYFGGTKKFELQKKHDRMKREYAERNMYRLLELNYKLNNSKEKIFKNMDNYISVIGGTPSQV